MSPYSIIKFTLSKNKKKKRHSSKLYISKSGITAFNVKKKKHNKQQRYIKENSNKEKKNRLYQPNVEFAVTTTQ